LHCIVILTNYYSVYEIKEDELGRACSTCGRRRISCGVLVKKCVRKMTAGGAESRREDNIKVK
jgi:hypothetical protein